VAPCASQMFTMFVARGFLYPEEGGDTLLRIDGSHKIHADLHSKTWRLLHFSKGRISYMILIILHVPKHINQTVFAMETQCILNITSIWWVLNLGCCIAVCRSGRHVCEQSSTQPYLTYLPTNKFWECCNFHCIRHARLSFPP
jgi:hypothetical protein